MTLKQAIKEITNNWEALYAVQLKGVYSHPKSVAVWVASSDLADSYEVDEEWIGITPQGNIAWAYASGCSCWDGDYVEDHKTTVKELTLTHQHTPEDWEKAIVAFAETKIKQELPRYDRYAN